MPGVDHVIPLDWRGRLFDEARCRADARAVAAHLVDAMLCGYASAGLIRVPAIAAMPSKRRPMLLLGVHATERAICRSTIARASRPTSCVQGSRSSGASPLAWRSASAVRQG